MSEELNELENLEPEPLDPRASFNWEMPNGVTVRAFESGEVNEENLPVWEFWIAKDNVISIHLANAAVSSDDPQFADYAWLTYQEGLNTIYFVSQVVDANLHPSGGCDCGGECGEGCDCDSNGSCGCC